MQCRDFRANHSLCSGRLYFYNSSIVPNSKPCFHSSSHYPSSVPNTASHNPPRHVCVISAVPLGTIIPPCISAAPPASSLPEARPSCPPGALREAARPYPYPYREGAPHTFRGAGLRRGAVPPSYQVGVHPSCRGEARACPCRGGRPYPCPWGGHHPSCLLKRKTHET